MEPRSSEPRETTPGGLKDARRAEDSGRPENAERPEPRGARGLFTEGTRSAFVILELHAPGEPAQPAGILLLDPAANHLHVKVTGEWPASLGRGDRAALEAISAEFAERAAGEPGETLLAEFEDSFSHLLRLSPRQAAAAGNPEREIARLFDRHVRSRAPARETPAPVIPFRTHLPFYPMRIAAGLFEGDTEVEAAAWVPVPEGVRPDERLFVARITGKSMEPRIPDGSCCLFRTNPQGSREGKLVLAQRFGVSESGGAFSIKKYHSEKAPQQAPADEGFGEGEWRHSRVRLISLNPLYPSWDLREDECRILAELVRVLDERDVPDGLPEGPRDGE